MELTLNEYQKRAMSTCMESCDNHSYMLMGLVGEVGELFSKLSKAIRKEKTVIVNNDFDTCGFSTDEFEDIKAELADCQWFIAGIANTFGWTLEEVCQSNLDKLADRAKRGVISGDGDHR